MRRSFAPSLNQNSSRLKKLLLQLSVKRLLEKP
jgi:hypothetical protein